MTNIHVNVSGKTYTGKNLIRLNDCLKQNSFKTSVWGTISQFNKQGIVVKKGETSKISISYPIGKYKNEKMRFSSHKVFNLSQTEFKSDEKADEFGTPANLLKIMLDTYPEVFI